MSRHILDHRSQPKTGLRLSRFARLQRRAGLNPKLASLFRRTARPSGTRTKVFLTIDRQG